MTRYAKLKRIVEKFQAEEVEGAVVDVQSANLYTQVYEHLSDINKQKLDNLEILQAFSLCWRLIDKK